MTSTRNIPLVNFSDSRLSWWAAIEGAVSLLVASLPIIGGRLIARWRHILTRNSVHQSLNFSKSFRSKHSVHTQHSIHELDPVPFSPGAYTGSEKTIETFVSSGSTLAGDSETLEEEPVSLFQHVTRMGRRGSTNTLNDPNSYTVTIKKEVYIREEHGENPLPSEQV
jgi:hypothetical protein